MAGSDTRGSQLLPPPCVAGPPQYTSLLIAKNNIYNIYNIENLAIKIPVDNQTDACLFVYAPLSGKGAPGSQGNLVDIRGLFETKTSPPSISREMKSDRYAA